LNGVETKRPAAQLQGLNQISGDKKIGNRFHQSKLMQLAFSKNGIGA